MREGQSPAERLALVKQRQRPRRNTGREPAAPPFWCGVRGRREGLNLSLRDVAGAVGLSVSSLHKIEYGGDLTLSHAFGLAAFFGVPVETLFTPRESP